LYCKNQGKGKGKGKQITTTAMEKNSIVTILNILFDFINLMRARVFFSKQQ
jgi:hypothetical protein